MGELQRAVPDQGRPVPVQEGAQRVVDADEGPVRSHQGDGDGTRVEHRLEPALAPSAVRGESGVLDRERGGDREGLQRMPRGRPGPQPVLRHVDREHADQPAVRGLQLPEQGVLGVPGVGVARHGQVRDPGEDVAGIGHRLGVVQEQQPTPRFARRKQLAPAGGALPAVEQRRTHLGRTGHGGNDHGTLLLIEQVDHRDLEAQGLRDGVCHELQRLRQVQGRVVVARVVQAPHPVLELARHVRSLLSPLVRHCIVSFLPGLAPFGGTCLPRCQVYR